MSRRLVAAIALLSTAACDTIVLGPERKLAGSANSSSTGGGGGGVVGPAQCDGRVIWAHRFGDTGDSIAYAVTHDGAGGVYVSGQFTGTLDLGGGPLVEAGAVDMFLARFDGDGKHLWSKRFGDSNPQSGQTRLTRTPDGGVIFSGNFKGVVEFETGVPITATFGEAFMVSYSAAGEHRWTWVSRGTGDEHIRAVAVTAAGDLVATGGCTNECLLGLTPLQSVSADQTDSFLVRFDKGGNPLWQHQFGTEQTDDAEWIAVDAIDRIIVVGRTSGDLDLGDGPLTNAGDEDAFAAIYSLEQGYIWGTLWGDAGKQQIARLAIDPTSNEMVVGGWLAGTIDFGTDSVALPQDDGIFLARLGEMGVHVASRGLARVHPRFGLAIDAGGSVVVAGTYRDALDVSGRTVAATGKHDGFVAKLGPKFEHLWSLTYGSAEDDGAISVTVDDASNVFFIGDFQGAIQLEGCPVFESEGAYDLLLAKLAP